MEDDMGKTSNTYIGEMKNMGAELWSWNVEGINHVGDLGTNGGLIVDKWFLGVIWIQLACLCKHGNNLYS
jgi:hypothetical protein